MTKRPSRESANDKKASENMSDKSPLNKRRKYNLRDRKSISGQESPPPPPDTGPEKKRRKKAGGIKEEILWINDDTLTDDSSDSTYSPSQDEYPVSVNIHIHANRPTEDTESESEESECSEKKNEDGFLMFLLEKYANVAKEEEKPKRGNHQKIPMKLNQSENKYFKTLDSKKQKEFINMMERVIKIGFEDGDVHYKFKILQLPISDYMKCHVIKKANALSDMPPDSGESYKLKNWIDGLLRRLKSCKL